MKYSKSIAALCTLLITSTAALSAQFYRWTDENGQPVIQRSIPPEIVKQGYEVIDESGNLIKTVAPELSLEEREAQRDALLAAQVQLARDEELLKLYRSPLDVDRAMKTWLSRQDVEIRVKQNRIKIKETEFDNLQSDAANREKTGQEIPQTLLDEMSDIQVQIANFQAEIAEIRAQQDKSRAVFMIDRDRMVVLWEVVNKRPWEEPEAENPQ